MFEDRASVSFLPLEYPFEVGPKSGPPNPTAQAATAVPSSSPNLSLS